MKSQAVAHSQVGPQLQLLPQPQPAPHWQALVAWRSWQPRAQDEPEQLPQVQVVD
jgi:hypothetical protein